MTTDSRSAAATLRALDAAPSDILSAEIIEPEWQEQWLSSMASDSQLLTIMTTWRALPALANLVTAAEGRHWDTCGAEYPRGTFCLRQRVHSAHLDPVPGNSDLNHAFLDGPCSCGRWECGERVALAEVKAALARP